MQEYKDSKIISEYVEHQMLKYKSGLQEITGCLFSGMEVDISIDTSVLTEITNKVKEGTYQSISLAFDTVEDAEKFCGFINDNKDVMEMVEQLNKRYAEKVAADETLMSRLLIVGE